MSDKTDKIDNVATNTCLNKFISVLKQDAPSQHTPSQHTPSQHTLSQHTPSQDTPLQDTPSQHTPSQGTPSKHTPSQDTPLQDTPSPSYVGNTSAILSTHHSFNIIRAGDPAKCYNAYERSKNHNDDIGTTNCVQSNVIHPSKQHLLSYKQEEHSAPIINSNILDIHVERINENESNKPNFCCKYCSGTGFSVFTIGTHLFKKHNNIIITKSVIFNEKEQLVKFIEDSFDKNKFGFIKIRGNYSTLKKKTTTFKCNLFRNCNKLCLAFYKVVDLLNGKYVCEYYNVHSHSMILDKVRLPKDLKHDLIRKLRKQVSFNTILSDIRKNVDRNNVGRLDIVTRAYLRYLRNTYLDNRLDKNDLTSLRKWSTLMKGKGLIIDHLEYSENSPKDFNFIYVFQSKEQQNIIQSLQCQVMMVDSTFGTNMYNYNLVPFLVLDEKQGEFLIAYAIMSSETTENIAVVSRWLADNNAKLKEIKYLMSRVVQNILI